MQYFRTIAILAVLLTPYVLYNVSAQEVVTVEIAEGAKQVDNGRFYVPAKIAVPAGTTVVWKNNDDAPHTVTSGSVDCPGLCWGLDFESGIMRLDDEYSFTFIEPGIHHYLCSLHPWMVGTVTVLGEGQQVPIELLVKPDRATYKLGDAVNIEGSVSLPIPDVTIIVEVLNPNNDSILSESVPVDNDGRFSYNFKLAGNEFIPGPYTVKVMYSDVLAEGAFVIERGIDDGNGGQDGGEFGADVRVLAKQIKDLLLLRVVNDESSSSSVYGITIDASGSVIDAFRGPRGWNDSVNGSEASSSSEDEPLNPGQKTYLKIKVAGDDFVINWAAFDSENGVLDQGEAKPLRR